MPFLKAINSIKALHTHSNIRPAADYSMSYNSKTKILKKTTYRKEARHVLFYVRHI